jgi:hypothetical protein
MFINIPLLQATFNKQKKFSLATETYKDISNYFIAGETQSV